MLGIVGTFSTKMQRNDQDQEVCLKSEIALYYFEDFLRLFLFYFYFITFYFISFCYTFILLFILFCYKCTSPMRKAFYQYAKMSHFLPAIFARKKVKEKCHTTKIQLLRFVKLHLKMIRDNFSEDCRNFAIMSQKKDT